MKSVDIVKNLGKMVKITISKELCKKVMMLPSYKYIIIAVIFVKAMMVSKFLKDDAFV